MEVGSFALERSDAVIAVALEAKNSGYCCDEAGAEFRTDGNVVFTNAS